MGMRGASRKAPVRKPAAVPASQRGATTHKTRLSQRLASYRYHHAQVAKESLAKLRATPLPTLMTIMVLAIALALPSGLYILLQNARIVSGGWEGTAQVSLYLRHPVSDQQAQALAAELSQQPEIARIQYLSRQQALEEFVALSGFGDLLQELDENPLPAVVVVYPESTDPVLAGQLRDRLAGLPEVDAAQLDSEWVQRLHAMLELGVRAVWALALTLALAVLLVITNTIRLSIESRRDEIVIIKMVGGTDAFVRRPFLYTGLWYGIGGGFVALALTETALIWLDGPVRSLASLYGSSFTLQGLSLSAAGMVMAGSAGLGLAGAWLAVSRHIREIEP